MRCFGFLFQRLEKCLHLRGVREVSIVATHVALVHELQQGFAVGRRLAGERRLGFGIGRQLLIFTQIPVVQEEVARGLSHVELRRLGRIEDIARDGGGVGIAVPRVGTDHRAVGILRLLRR